MGRTPPSSELLQQRKRKRQTHTAAGEKEEEVCEEQEEVKVEEVGSWSGEDVQMNAKKKAKYSPIR